MDVIPVIAIVLMGNVIVIVVTPVGNEKEI